MTTPEQDSPRRADLPITDAGGSPPPGAARSLLEAARAAVRQVAAVLSFDSREEPAQVAGMRSAVGHTRHLVFSTHGRDVDLRIRPESQGFELSGQILGPDEAGAIELAGRGTAAGARREAWLDAGGEFLLPGLAEGTYDLRLRLDGGEIVLPPIVLGPSAR